MTDAVAVKFRWFAEPRFLVTLGTIIVATIGFYVKIITYMESNDMRNQQQDTDIRELKSQVANTNNDINGIKSTLSRLDERSNSQLVILGEIQRKLDK